MTEEITVMSAQRMTVGEIKQLVQASQILDRLHSEDGRIIQANATLQVVAHDAMNLVALELAHNAIRQLESMQNLFAKTGFPAEAESFSRARIAVQRGFGLSHF